MKGAMRTTPTLLLCLCLCLAVPVPADTPDTDVHMTIRQVAHSVGTTGKELAHSLGLPLETEKQTQLRELGATEEKLDEAARHAAEEESLSWLKYPFWTMLCAFALFLLVKGRASKGLYLSALALSLAVTGFLPGKPSNPMESVVKLFKTAMGIYPDVLVKVLGFALLCLLAVVGNKLICGWGCPSEP